MWPVQAPILHQPPGEPVLALTERDPVNPEEDKRGPGPWAGEGPTGPAKGFLGSRCSPGLLSTNDQNGGWGRKGKQGKGHQLEPLPLGAPPRGPHG